MSRARLLAERRRELVARSDVHRADLAGIMDDLESRTVLLDIAVSTARRVHRHRVLVGAAAVGLVLAPLAARSWIRRVLWAAPLVLEGYHVFKALRDVRHGRPSGAA